MRVTAFGEVARILRLRYDLTLKSMAEAMGISSAHLSGIEFGEKALSEKHIRAALEFFKDRATADELINLRDAADRTLLVVDTKDLSSDARGLVAAFARRLQQGSEAPPEVRGWIASRSKLKK